MKINIRALADYLQCPLMYRFKYVDKLIPQRKFIVYEAFDQAIHQLFYYLFNQVQNKWYPSEYHMKMAWGRIWCPDRSREQIISHLYSNAHKVSYNPRLKERHGLDMGLNMREYYKDSPGTPILVGYAYSVPIGRHTVEGILELVREINGQLEITDAKVSLRKVPPSLIRHDVELTAASYALRYLMKAREDRVVYYYLEGNKQLPGKRDTEDYKNLAGILSRVEVALGKKLFWPSMNDMCGVCSYRQYCARKEWYR